MRLLRSSALMPLRVVLVAVGLLAGTVVGVLPAQWPTLRTTGADVIADLRHERGPSGADRHCVRRTRGARSTSSSSSSASRAGGRIGAIAGHVTLDATGSFTTTVTVPWAITALDHPRYSVLAAAGPLRVRRARP